MFNPHPNREYKIIQCFNCWETIMISPADDDKKAMDMFGVQCASSREDFIILCEECMEAHVRHLNN